MAPAQMALHRGARHHLNIYNPATLTGRARARDGDGQQTMAEQPRGPPSHEVQPSELQPATAASDENGRDGGASKGKPAGASTEPQQYVPPAHLQTMVDALVTSPPLPVSVDSHPS